MKASVVMATRNPEIKPLREALESIYSQTFRNFEIIIVDDGSTSPVSKLARPFIKDDIPTRIYTIGHLGLGAALNYGISQANGEYIIRLDDDDLMLPARIETQVKFLDEHPEISCVGTWFYDKAGDKILKHRQYPTSHDGIVHDLLSLKWGLAHTSVAFRKTAYEKIGGYRIAGGGQDLDLFLQLGSVGYLANIPDYLTVYTMSANGLGTVNKKKSEAYLFALNDVIDRNLYPKYHAVAVESKEKLLKKTENKNNILKGKIMRMLLVARIKCLGDSIPRY